MINQSFFFSIELFNALYRRVLCRQRVNDDQLTVTSLQALAKVYKRYHAEIGQFSDMSYILQLLDRVSTGFHDNYQFIPIQRLIEFSSSKI